MNLLGDVTHIITTAGTVVVEYVYDAYGNIVYQTPNQIIAFANSFRYRSYKFDNETSWYYLNSRYYSSEMSRFINSDGLLGSVGNIIGHNMYIYCANNSVLYQMNHGSSTVVFPTSEITPFIAASSLNNLQFSENDDLVIGWWNKSGSWYNGSISIFHANSRNWSITAGLAKNALMNMTQKNLRLIYLSVELVRVEYLMLNESSVYSSFGVAKAYAGLNSKDGYGAEAKLVLFAIGVKGEVIGVNLDIGAVGYTFKYHDGQFDIGASAAFGVTISVNLFTLLEWIDEVKGE